MIRISIIHKFLQWNNFTNFFSLIVFIVCEIHQKKILIIYYIQAIDKINYKNQQQTKEKKIMKGNNKALIVAVKTPNSLMSRGRSNSNTNHNSQNDNKVLSGRERIINSSLEKINQISREIIKITAELYPEKHQKSEKLNQLNTTNKCNPPLKNVLKLKYTQPLIIGEEVWTPKKEVILKNPNNKNQNLTQNIQSLEYSPFSPHTAKTVRNECQNNNNCLKEIILNQQKKKNMKSTSTSPAHSKIQQNNISNQIKLELEKFKKTCIEELKHQLVLKEMTKENNEYYSIQNKNNKNQKNIDTIESIEANVLEKRLQSLQISLDKQREKKKGIQDKYRSLENKINGVVKTQRQETEMLKNQMNSMLADFSKIREKYQKLQQRNLQLNKKHSEIVVKFQEKLFLQRTEKQACQELFQKARKTLDELKKVEVESRVEYQQRRVPRLKYMY